ncbi:hypothetical protein INR49_015951, partial [Caranx melampygus]
MLDAPEILPVVPAMEDAMSSEATVTLPTGGSAAVSDGELNSVELQGCSSDNSLNSNASLPSVQSHRRHTERRVASWAVCFERLLQDPVGVRYFSEFLKKEFSEENILFWQACEYFSHVPENDKKQRAREIFNSFLSSKATTPVNIDSQAQLADDILNAPRPDMFKEQQLQIFNLMKFDSYTRFLKSLLYQECMLAEVEGRPLPDPYHIPSSPTSKHSTTGSDRSNLSTPKKDSREDSGDRRKGMFFSWSRNRSFGKGPKKRELADFNYNFSGSNGRRESQGSLSSGASLELGTSGSGRNEGDVSRGAVSVSTERGVGSAPMRQCNISLPDGSCCSVPLRAGVSIRDLLLGLLATNQAVPPPYDPEPSCSTPNSRNPNNGSFPSSGRRGNKANSSDRGGGGGNHLLHVSHQSQSLDSALGTESGGGRKARPPPPFPGTISPIHPSQGAQRGLLLDSGRGESVQMLEEDTLSDLTLVGEGDINSPSLNY